MATVVKCKYCNEMLMAEFPEGATEKEKERMTIEFCECDLAKRETGIYKEIQRAKSRAEELFGEKSKKSGFEVIDSQKVHDLMNQAVELLPRGTIKDITIKITSEDVARIKIKDDEIEVERTQTRKRKL